MNSAFILSLTVYRLIVCDFLLLFSNLLKATNLDSHSSIFSHRKLLEAKSSRFIDKEINAINFKESQNFVQAQFRKSVLTIHSI